MFNLLKRLKRNEWILIAIGFVFIVGQVWLEITMPDYMREITEKMSSPGTKVSEVLVPGAYMLACALGSAILAIITGFFIAKIAASFSKRVRGEVFEKVQNFGTNEMKKFSTASLITRSTNDVTQVQTFLAMGLQLLIKAPIMAVWAVIKILGKSWEFSLITGVGVALMLVFIAIIVLIALPKFKKIQALTDNLNKVTRENLTGLRVVRAYNAENFESRKFEKANGELTKVNLFTGRVMALMSPFITIIMGGLNLAIYWVGAVLVESADMINKVDIFSDMMIFSQYAMMVVMSIIMLTMLFIMLPRVLVSSKRINEVLITEPTIADGAGKFDTKIEGVVEFINVGFKYPDAEEYVLKDISFKANKGETVAFIGSTGSGKSTLINLIPRFYDISEGVVLVDGIDVRDYKLEELNNKLGYISQKAVIFSGSIEHNLSFGSNGKEKPTEEQMKKALKIAQGLDFVEALPEGLKAELDQGGKNVSGGQKQRLSIARAIARDPEIFIFDDSFSALDYKTDKKLRQALSKELKDKTCLIVAQRIGTIKNADKIIVLDEGTMVGIGTHDELMKNCKVYKEIAYSQLSKEELENGRK